MAMENIHNSADDGAIAPDTTEIVDNGANSEIVHSADRDMSISVVIDNSVLEKSLKSVIMDNGTPDKSDGAHNSSLDTNVYSATCQKSGDIDEGPQQPILKCYDSAVNLFLEISIQLGTNVIHATHARNT